MAHGSEEGPTGQKVAAAGSMHKGPKRVDDNRMGARTRNVLRRVAKPTTDEPEWTLLSHTLYDKYARPLVDTRSQGVCLPARIGGCGRGRCRWGIFQRLQRLFLHLRLEGGSWGAGGVGGGRWGVC